MTEDDALKAVRAEPDSDERRRELARYWLQKGDPRGEIVNLSLQVADLERRRVEGDARMQLRDKLHALLEQHGASMRAPLTPLVERVCFYRGLPSLVETSVDHFLDVASKLFELAPIQHADLKAPATRFGELCRSPHLSKLRSLALDYLNLGDAGAKQLSESPYVANLRWLSLFRNGIGNDGVRALAASPYLAKCNFLSLESNPANASPIVSGLDLDGRINAVEDSPLAADLERRYGHRPWLHASNVKILGDWPPSRDLPVPFCPRPDRS